MTDPDAASDAHRLFRAVGLPMLLVDPSSGLVEDANEALCRLYGRTREELIGRSPTLVTQSSLSRLRDAMASVADGPTRTFAVSTATAGGNVLPMTATISSVDLDGRRLILAAFTERGERPDAQANLNLLYEATADIHRAIARAGTETELWSEAARIMVDVAGFRLAWVSLADPDRRFASVAAAAGDVACLAGRVDDLTAANPTPVARAIAEGRPFVNDDLATQDAGPYGLQAHRLGFRSGASVPMREGDQPAFGALVVLDGRPAALPAERLALLERLAADLSVARSLLRTAERLRASEARHRSIVEQASAGIMVFDQRGWVLDANPAACAMLGYALEDLRAVGPEITVHDLSAAEEAGMRDLLLSGSAVWVDRRFRKADGEVITVAFHGQLREDGSVEAVVQDVTAERRAQEALRASEARYRDLVSILQEGIITYDADGRVTMMNEAARRLHGPGAGDLTGRDARAIATAFLREDGSPLPPEELPTQIAFRTGRKTERVLIGMPQADGEIRWVSSNAVPTGLDATGRPSGIVVSFADVTELREALARAEASEDRAQALVDGAFDGVFVLDEAGLISYANPAAEAIALAPRGSLVGRPFADLVAPEHRTRIGADLVAMAGGRAMAGEYAAVRGDGAALTLEVTGSRLADGRVELIARDVTARKALEAERDRLAQASEQASDAIFITDAAGAIVYVNRAYERMNGYLREEVVGQAPGVHLGPECAALEAEIAASLAASGAWAGEVTHRAKDGTRFRVSSRVVALRDPAGRVSGRVAISRDISLEREQDARLAQTARIDAVAQLAGGVAHDLNNVLTMIVGHAALLDPLTSTPADIAEGARAITAAAGQAETLTLRLLAFGRRSFLRPRRADLRDLVSESGPILSRALGGRVALAVSPGPEPMPVSLDPNLFEQALLAIAVHAREAMPDGGTLRIGVEAPRSDEALPGAGTAVLVIADSGPGISPEALDRLFEPFATGADDATGLGLAMAHGFVQQSGGRMSASSVPGRGTTFRILLPLTPPDERRGRPAAPRQPDRVGPATILVVDDEPVLRQVAQRALAGRGYTVLLAGSGEEALRVAAAHEGRIDLLFTDVVMPGLRGPGLAAALMGTRPDMRVLLTSGYAEDAIGRRGIESTADAFLPKPYTPSMLAATVAELLEASGDEGDGSDGAAAPR